MGDIAWDFWYFPRTIGGGEGRWFTLNIIPSYCTEKGESSPNFGLIDQATIQLFPISKHNKMKKDWSLSCWIFRLLFFILVSFLDLLKPCFIFWLLQLDNRASNDGVLKLRPYLASHLIDASRFFELRESLSPFKDPLVTRWFKTSCPRIHISCTPPPSPTSFDFCISLIWANSEVPVVAYSY